MPIMQKLVTYYSSHFLMQVTQIQNLRESPPPSNRLYFASLKREMNHERSFCNIHSLLKCVSDTLDGSHSNPLLLTWAFFTVCLLKTVRLCTQAA